jgi:hypothetical protein
MRSGTKETSERNNKLDFVNNFIGRAGNDLWFKPGQLTKEFKAVSPSRKTALSECMPMINCQ